jgi:hypothetical protein
VKRISQQKETVALVALGSEYGSRTAAHGSTTDDQGARLSFFAHACQDGGEAT